MCSIGFCVRRHTFATSRGTSSLETGRHNGQRWHIAILMIMVVMNHLTIIINITNAIITTDVKLLVEACWMKRIIMLIIIPIRLVLTLRSSRCSWCG
jgi:hypothetical protein